MTCCELVSRIVIKIPYGRTNCSEDNEGSEKIHDVRKVLAIEGFSQCPLLIRPCQKKMKQCNDSALKFRSTSRVDGSRGESFPDDRFADIGSDEERNS